MEILKKESTSMVLGTFFGHNVYLSKVGVILEPAVRFTGVMYSNSTTYVSLFDIVRIVSYFLA